MTSAALDLEQRMSRAKVCPWGQPRTLFGELQVAREASTPTSAELIEGSADELNGHVEVEVGRAAVGGED